MFSVSSFLCTDAVQSLMYGPIVGLYYTERYKAWLGLQWRAMKHCMFAVDPKQSCYPLNIAYREEYS